MKKQQQSRKHEKKRKHGEIFRAFVLLCFSEAVPSRCWRRATMQVSRNTNTPEPELGGVSARREGTLRGVLGWYPLMPVLVHRVFIVCGPEIGPEPHRLGRWRAAPDDDTKDLGLDRRGDGWKHGHGLAPHARGIGHRSPERAPFVPPAASLELACRQRFAHQQPGARVAWTRGIQSQPVSAGHVGLQSIRPAVLREPGRRRRLGSSSWVHPP
jgi:hypothetical protein